MEREIKFRAWDGSRLRSWESIKETRGFHHWVIEGCEGVHLMQFTGIHDKNRKEIYEGDILEFYSPIKFSNGRNNFISPVKLENGAFTIDILKSDLKCNNGDFIGWGLCNGWTKGTVSIHAGTDGYMEVIGNIYENPELLK